MPDPDKIISEQHFKILALPNSRNLIVWRLSLEWKINSFNTLLVQGVGLGVPK